MIRTKLVRAFSKLHHLAGLAGVGLFVMSVGLSLPVSIEGDSLASNPAMARGGENGGGNGNGGGRGNGRGGGRDGGKHLQAAAQDNGSSRKGNATGHRHASSHSHQIQIATANNEFGQLTSRLGSLNAAHAAPQAFENASGNSVIGALRDYMASLVDFVFGGDPQDAQDAADALERAANKDELIAATVIDRVNELLDGKRAGFSHEAESGDPIHESEDDIYLLINSAP